MKTIKFYYLCTLLLILSLAMHGQKLSPIAKQVFEAQKARRVFSEMPSILTIQKNFNKSLYKSEMPTNATYLTYNKGMAKQLIKAHPKGVSLQVPINEKSTYTLDLVEVPASFYDYIVKTGSGKVIKGNATKALHYRGVVKGLESESMVALSFFENEMSGVISINGQGNFNLGKMLETATHILYKDSNLKNPFSFECGTTDDITMDYDSDMLMGKSLAKVDVSEKCVKIYLETQFDIYQDKGSVANVETYITALFNQVATIYFNEGITIQISELKIWDIPDPYTGYDSDSVLLINRFIELTTTMNGDLGQLLNFKNIGGRAVINGLCRENIRGGLSVSGINNRFMPIPTYSWSVFIMAHEFGHLFGSLHTHACIWNGNSTAIDGCWTTNGGCPQPGLPPKGGTIMSYCHLKAVGINLALGFGPQPGNVMRNSVRLGACLNTCLDGDCTENLAITAPVVSGSSSIENANLSITASNTVNDAATATYQTGNEITLKNNFVALAGSDFLAYIGVGCPISGLESQSVSDQSFEYQDQDTTALIPSEEAKANETDFNIYPNPFTNTFSIEFRLDIAEEIHLDIFNIQGKKLVEVVLNAMPKTNNRVFYDGSWLSSGLYIYRLYSKDKWQQGKLVKK